MSTMWVSSSQADHSSVVDGSFGPTVWVAVGAYVVMILVSLALLVPTVCVGVRRLHDTDKSGWWLLIALIPLVGIIVLIVFWATEGKRETNQWGPSPKFV